MNISTQHLACLQSCCIPLHAWRAPVWSGDQNYWCSLPKKTCATYKAINMYAPERDVHFMILWVTMTTYFLFCGKVSPAVLWHLRVTDVTLDSHVVPIKIILTIKASKTNLFARGSPVCVHKMHKGFAGKYSVPSILMHNTLDKQLFISNRL